MCALFKLCVNSCHCVKRNHSHKHNSHLTHMLSFKKEEEKKNSQACVSQPANKFTSVLVWECVSHCKSFNMCHQAASHLKV